MSMTEGESLGFAASTLGLGSGCSGVWSAFRAWAGAIKRKTRASGGCLGAERR